MCVHNEDFNTSCWSTDGFFNDLRDMRVEQRFRYDFPLRVNVERLLKTCFNFMRERIRRQPQKKMIQAVVPTNSNTQKKRIETNVILISQNAIKKNTNALDKPRK